MTIAERTAADLRLIADLWPDLAESRFPDVARPYQRPVITLERRAELDHQARIERLERNGLAPGEHVDAVRPEILDLMVDVLIEAEGLAGIVCVAGRCPQLAPPSTAFADARPYLLRAAADVHHLALGQDLDYVARIARRMVAAVSRTLGLVYDGQHLEIVCPWCRGGLTGAPSWRVRELPGDQVAIVCESGLCEPPTKSVGTWWRGAPCWPLREWDWLAGQVRAADSVSA